MSVLTQEHVGALLVRVADLWPDGLEAVPGSYEVALKRDADTIRALAKFWRDVQLLAAGSVDVREEAEA
jgi:hypothetical protein